MPCDFECLADPQTEIAYHAAINPYHKAFCLDSRLTIKYNIKPS